MITLTAGRAFWPTWGRPGWNGPAVAESRADAKSVPSSPNEPRRSDVDGTEITSDVAARPPTRLQPVRRSLRDALSIGRRGRRS